MNNRSKAIICILLAILLLVGVVACGEETADDTSSAVSVGEVSAEASTEDVSEEISEEISTDPYAHLRNYDFEDDTVTFLVNGVGYGGRYMSVEIMSYEDNPEALNEAIEERNKTVEYLLDVRIDEVRSDDLKRDARNDINGGGSYDIFVPYMPDAAIFAAEGSLLDLNSVYDILDLDDPSWDQAANNEFSFADKLYFTTGDFSLLTFDCTYCIVFNKTLASKCGADDMYELLRTGKWTFDAMHRNAKLATADTDGKDGMTSEDTWGLYFNNGYLNGLFIGAGEHLAVKDADDIPHMFELNDRVSSIVAKMRDIYTDSSSTIIIEKMQKGINDKDFYYSASRATGEDRALFRTDAIIDLGELDDFECNYGILPTPKYDESQPEYLSMISEHLTGLPGVLYTETDPETVSYIMEAMAAASHYDLQSAYYDVTLKTKSARDDESLEMLDLIFKNRILDIGELCNFGTFSTNLLRWASGMGDYNIMSRYAANESKIEADVEKFIAAVDEIDSKGSPLRFYAGISTFGRQIDWRNLRTASPHGYKIGEILASNIAPTPGTDKIGATGVIKSACKLPLSKMTCGAALDIKLTPSSADGEDGIEAIMGLFRGFVNLGGSFLQVDVMDNAMLLDAQKHPENYPTLAVRVSGWSARFITLNAEWQQMIIERTAQNGI